MTKPIRATTLVVVKMCKMQKVLNFAHFNPKNTHISLCKNVQIFTMTLQMNSNRTYMHGYCSCVNDFFLFFFSLSSIKLLLFPNVYNNPARQNKKKEEENNHPITKPNATNKHHNLV